VPAPPPASAPAARAPVTFWLAPSPARDLAALRTLEPDRDAARLVRGVEVWIAGTHARLAAAGAPVRLDDRLPEGGTVVFHAGEKRALRAALEAARAVHAAPPHRRAVEHASPLVLVGVRGDLNAATIADFEVVQTRAPADGVVRFHVPHWPQPGLLPRDPDRGTRLETVAYKGDPANLHPYFHSAAWRDGLAALGVAWRIDGPDAAAGWADYRDVDVVLALRPADPRGHRHKPASKLQNAWLAGVPAICGVEVPLRELRQDDLDYVEIAEPADALTAVRTLRDDAARYAAMVGRASARAGDVDVAATTARWTALLWQQLPERIAALGDAYFTAGERRRRARRRTMRRLVGLEARR
jgi:hypothetical protein